ncbi:MAG TPA: carboxylesterase family protein [Acidimicrobiales bacterium]|nr:carboxylesterase family protein [Acidimicrobiales bacterium]
MSSTTSDTAPAVAAAAPTAATAHGPVAGATVEGVHVFRGVPYAASTAGEGRFAPPRPPEPWTDALDCTGPGRAAPQNPSILETALGETGLAYDEDCLQVNVFSTDLGTSAPVMVWFHGGGFETGTASMSWYDGSRLARRGVVVVAVGYRLGALGYLDLPGVEGSGCFGLLDQVASLRWVRDNVAAFGGDADRVTVFGESAGAMSIGALLAAPGTEGLFHRAILQSGSTHNVQDPALAGRIAGRFAAEAGVDLGDLDALRALPVATVLAAQGEIGRSDDGQFGLPWQPVLGSEAVPRDPIDAVRDGVATGIEILVGTTLEEMKLFPLITPSLADVDDEALVARAGAFEALMGREPGSLLASYTERLGHLPAPDRWLALLTDLVFRIPAIRLAEAQAAHDTPIRMYLFAEASDMLGSCHALDLPFTWDNIDMPGTELLVGEISEARRTLARRLGDVWAAFARGEADPAAPDMPAWPLYEPGRRATMWFSAERVAVVEDPMGVERTWWDGLEGGLGFDLTIVA